MNGCMPMPVTTTMFAYGYGIFLLLHVDPKHLTL